MSHEHSGRSGPSMPRARSGAPGRRPARTGSEPTTARSPLRLRLLLAAVFLPLFVAAAVLFGVGAGQWEHGDSPSRAVLATVAAVCAVLALTAAMDLWIVAQRLRRERGGRLLRE
ncbi:DUF6343 family protein [Streptomyces sp. 7R007]